MQCVCSEGKPTTLHSYSRIDCYHDDTYYRMNNKILLKKITELAFMFSLT